MGQVPHQVVGGGEFNPLTAFFRKNVKLSACPKFFFCDITIFCIVTSSLSTGSNEIFIKKRRKNRLFSFFSTQWTEEGGLSLVSMSIKFEFFTPSRS